MTKPNFSLAKSDADKLLRDYRIVNPPIDPEWIAEAEGLRVTYADFAEPESSEVSGFFRLMDNTIVVNNAISENRITFTIAHELAHYRLHQAYIRSNNYMPMPRNNVYDGPKPVQEVEADWFAASLLVPLKMLKRYKGISNVFELSRMFLVSEDVIKNRLNLLARHPGLADT